MAGNGLRTHPVFRFARGEVRTRVYVYFVTCGICGRLRHVLGVTGVGGDMSSILGVTGAVTAVEVGVPGGKGIERRALLLAPTRRSVGPLFSIRGVLSKNGDSSSTRRG